MPTKPKPPKAKRQKPLSLYGHKPDEVLRKMLATKPLRKAKPKK